MEVILSEDIQNLGRAGSVVKVKDGYARNFLFPKKLALTATPDNLKRIKQLEEKRQEKYGREKESALELAEKLEKVSCTVNVEVNDLDKLYGAISQADVAKALEVEGYAVDKKDIVFDSPVEELGIFEVNVNLHPEVTAKIKVWVTKK